MAKLKLSELTKKYPEADEDFLVMMLENRIFMTEYIAKKGEEIVTLVDKSKKEIVSLFTSYFDEQKRERFVQEDKPYLLLLKKRAMAIINKVVDKVYAINQEDIEEVYNYNALQIVWMLDVKLDTKSVENDNTIGEQEELVGEAKTKTDGSSPYKIPELTSSRKEKLSSNIYGSTTKQRMDNIKTSSDKALTTTISQSINGKGMTKGVFMTALNTTLDKQLSRSLKRANELGLEEAEEWGELDAIDANGEFFSNFQRVEVLDRKTCILCASSDGEITPMPSLKLHPRCRAVSIPTKLGEDGSVQYRQGISGRRRRDDAYNTWFNKLPEQVKREKVGVQKYEMLKSGKIKDLKSLISLNRAKDLTQLKQKDLYSKLAPKIKSNPKAMHKIINQKKGQLSQPDIWKITTQKQVTEYKKFLDFRSLLYGMAGDAESLKGLDLEKSAILKIEKKLYIKKALKRAGKVK